MTLLYIFHFPCEDIYYQTVTIVQQWFWEWQKLTLFQGETEKINRSASINAHQIQITWDLEVPEQQTVVLIVCSQSQVTGLDGSLL